MKFFEGRKDDGICTVTLVIRSFIAADTRAIKGPRKPLCSLYATQSSPYFFITVDTRKIYIYFIAERLYDAESLNHSAENGPNNRDRRKSVS